jgi:hypothetical protein
LARKIFTFNQVSSNGFFSDSEKNLKEIKSGNGDCHSIMKPSTSRGRVTKWLTLEEEEKELRMKDKTNFM